jgi:uncharacterized membrane protein
MLSYIDILLLLSFTVFFARGWQKGLLLSVMGPISLIIGCFLAYINFQTTKNMVSSMLISLIAPIGLNFGFSMFLKLWMNPNADSKPSFSVNRLLGGLLGVLWSGGMLIISLILMSVAPPWGVMKSLQEVLNDSKIYATIQNKFVNKETASALDLQKTLQLFQDEEKLEALQSTDEFQDFIQDPKIRALLMDEESVKQMQNKDMVGLLQNPQLMDILQDKKTLAKFVALHQRMQQPLEESE